MLQSNAIRLQSLELALLKEALRMLAFVDHHAAEAVANGSADAISQARQRASVPLGGGDIDCCQDRLHTADAA